MSTALTTTELTGATWAPCATCWGQRCVYENPNGEGLVPCTCPTCLGVGERLLSVD